MSSDTVSDTQERRKRANGTGVPEALADLTPREQQTFERDFKRATAEGSRWRQMARSAGRGYLALGWRLYRDALVDKPRRRKGPNECRDTKCPCVAHKRNRATKSHDDMCGIDGRPLCDSWPNCPHSEGHRQPRLEDAITDGAEAWVEAARSRGVLVPDSMAGLVEP